MSLIYRKIICHRKQSRFITQSQQGVVIVVALFMVALIASMAFYMMTRLLRDTERSSLILHDTQAEFYAQGSLAWAMDELRKDWDEQKPQQIIDQMPISSPVTEINGYQIKSTIEDMQARFNLNNIHDENSLNDFKRLIKTVDDKISAEKADEIARALLDWISQSTQDNALSKYYLQLPLPYRPAHRPMISISELRLVKGMTPTLFAELEPFITALPSITLLNVQTASAPTLVTLSESITLATGEMLVKTRLSTPFMSKENFMNLDVLKNHPIPAEKITVVSDYFLVTTLVKIGDQQIVIYTLLKRLLNENKKAMINILWQSKNIW